jgi:PAS domain S-box-containing protein
MKISLPGRINLALGLGVGLVLLVAWGSFSTINALIDDAQRVTRTQQTFVLLERLGHGLETAQSRHRDYLLAPDAGKLNDYQQARTGVEGMLARIHAEGAPEDGGAQLRALEGSISRRLALMEQAVQARQQQGLAAAAAIVGRDLNRQLAEEIDSLADKLISTEMQDLQQSQHAGQRSAQVAKMLIVSGGLLTLALMMGAIFFINHYQAGRRRVEAQLRDSEAMSRAITEGMAEGVITTRTDGLIVEVNEAALALFAYRREQMVGLQVAQLIPERYRGQFQMLIDELRMRKDNFREVGREVLARRSDGSEFPVTVSFGDVLVGGQRLFSAIVHDITESIRNAEALRASEAQLRQITDAVPALIAYVDVGQRFVFHNQAYEEIFGLSAQQINGKTMREVMGEDLYASVRRQVDEVLAGYAVSYERTHATARLGVRDYAMNYFPQYGDGGQRDQVIGFFSLGTDITEMKRIDRMKSEFVSTVSHELRTPLTSIRGSLGLIAGGVAGAVPEAVKNLVDIAKNNCERLIRLINDILDSEKIESGQMRLALQEVALQPLLQQVLVANEGFASQHGVSLRLHAPDAPVQVNIDVDRITQVLTNLLSNAVKFSPRSGAVEVRLSTQDGWARVEVRDHGPGIPDEFRSRIFQKFSQADSSDTRLKGGTGLGLAISKAIVERLGGAIGFSSVTGAGTTFFFELPECEKAPAPDAIRLAASAQRILVCEPDPDIARLISMMLEKAGFEVDVVPGCQQVQARLAGQSYAAMTVDLKPTDQDGVALILALRSQERTRHLPIVVVSAAAGESQICFNSQPLSVSNWLDKPIDENLLVRGLRSAIAGMASGRPRILHVEDDLDIQRVTAAIAQDFATFEFAATLQQARAQLRAHRFDLILLDLDLGLPGGSGWDLFADIEALQPRPPVVVFSASDVGAEQGRRAAAVLVKARTSTAELLETLQRVLQSHTAHDDKDS